jgi:hypothetical protein
VVHDQGTVAGPTNVKFNAVDAIFFGGQKGSQGVFALDHVEPSVRKDLSHPSSVPEGM